MGELVSFLYFFQPPVEHVLEEVNPDVEIEDIPVDEIIHHSNDVVVCSRDLFPDGVCDFGLLHEVLAEEVTMGEQVRGCEVRVHEVGEGMGLWELGED